MKKHKRRWVIIGLIVAVLFIWLIRYFNNDEVSTHIARLTEYEDKIRVSAVYVRDEDVYTTQDGGILIGRVKSGTKVSSGSYIATVYQGSIKESEKQEIEEINSRIEMLDELSSGNANFSSDMNSVENDIRRGVGQIIDLTLKDDLSALDVASINLEEVMNVGNGGVINDTVASLEERRIEIESSISAPKEQIYAKNSGIFFPFTDGYEETFKAKEYDQITLDMIEDCVKNAKNVKSNEVLEYNASDKVCKTVNNTKWLLACQINKADVYGLKKGNYVKIRIADDSGSEAEAKIIKLYSEDNEKYLCVLELGDAIKNAYCNRVSEMEIIKVAHSGLQIPAGALRFSPENEPGVYVNSNGTVKFRKVNVLYTNDDVAIVENSGTDGMIHMYDSVILDRDGIYEGKLVK